ncbi:MAG TPA: CHAD domain-containing protein [Stellaceae bacterium]|nr:CHAD domain-containing protein [Stellaceae bacterium]
MASDIPTEAAGPASEVELKFAIAPQELRRLGRHPLLAGPPLTRRAIASTYFDTPDLALRRKSLALRVRKEGRRYVQTLKTAGKSTVANVTRSEWQSPVATALPDLSLPEMQDRLADLDGATLKPVFTSRIRRSSRIIMPDAATKIEVSYDHGTIETSDGTKLPVCELELELKEGPSQALFDVARALNRAASLRLETRSKAERGYGLLDGRNGDASWTTATRGRVELSRDMAVEDALAAIVRHCLQHMLANDDAALNNAAEGVHQMRVALRRLRATFSLFKGMIPEAQQRWATGEMRRIASALGEARNWDVLAEHLAPIEAEFPDDRGVAALSRKVTAKRRAAYELMRETVASSGYTEFALRMMTWIETRGWRDQAISEASAPLLAPLGDMADHLLERRHRKARKLAKRFDDLDADGRHQLRIALKKLRYAADSLQRVYDPKPVRRHLRRLSALQDDLGLLNDIATMDRLIHELDETSDAAEGWRRGAAVLQGWYGHVLAQSTPYLGKRIARFLKARPFWRRPGDA